MTSECEYNDGCKCSRCYEVNKVKVLEETISRISIELALWKGASPIIALHDKVKDLQGKLDVANARANRYLEMIEEYTNPPEAQPSCIVCMSFDGCKCPHNDSAIIMNAGERMVFCCCCVRHVNIEQYRFETSECYECFNKRSK